MALPTQETQTAEAALPDYWSWEVAGAPANVRVNLDVVDAMSADVIQGFNALPRRGVEVGGMLLGRREGDTIVIERFESIPCEYRFGPSYILSDQDKREFDERRAALQREGKESILGFYRSHTRRDLQLEPSDLEVIQRWFDDPASVFLVVKPLDISHVMAEFFFFQDGKLRMESAGREFPFKGRGIGAVASPPKPLPFAPPPRPADKPAAASPPNHLPTPRVELPRRPPPAPAFTRPAPRGFFSKYWEVLAAMVLVLGAAGLFWWQHSGNDDSDGEDQPTAAAVSAPASLGLDVKPDPGVWHVTWSPSLPLIQNADHGVLSIQDGSVHDRVVLDRNQLRGGGVPYRHIGEDVSFHLEVVAPDNKRSSESFRVLLASRPKRPEPSPPSGKPEPAAAVPAKAAAPPPVEVTKATHRLIPAEVVRRVQPEITEGIRSRISQEMAILVKINIDEKGRVTHATPITRGDGLTSYLSSRASEAALKWQFEPAHEDGHAVASSQVIRFVFEQ